MLVYGEGGVGKTTFISTAPNPILADCENGAKYFGLRGIKLDVAQIESWRDMREFLEVAKLPQYDTIAIDPIGELMEKLKRFMVAQNDSKLVQKDGAPTMAGWGWLKKTMRDYVKVLRDLGKHVIIVAHLEESKDEDRMIKRPKVETKLSDELVSIVDIVGYMTVTTSQEGEEKRIIIVDPSNDKYTAKDRTGQLGKIIEPDFSKIIDACQGTKTFAWSKQKPEEPLPPTDEKKSKKSAKVAEPNEVEAEEVEQKPERSTTPASEKQLKFFYSLILAKYPSLEEYAEKHSVDLNKLTDQDVTELAKALMNGTTSEDGGDDETDPATV